MSCVWKISFNVEDYVVEFFIGYTGVLIPRGSAKFSQPSFYNTATDIEQTTDLVIDWIYLLWVSKVKPNYTIRNSLPGTTWDINFTSNSVLYMKKQRCR